MQKKIITSIIILFLLHSTLISVKGNQQPENKVYSEIIKVTEETYEYYNYQNMTKLLHELQVNYSDIMSVTSYGKTYQGRDIWIVKLSDNVSIDEDEPGVLLDGAHHGNENPSYEILIYFIKHMVENYSKENTDDDKDGQMNEDPIDGFDNDEDGLTDEDPSEDRVREAINNTQIYLIPMVNPDGVEANTRKNCAPNYGMFGLRKKITSYGVDLNRNYGYLWLLKYLLPLRYRLFDIGKDSSLNYSGEKPFCENETKALKQFVEKHNLSLSMSYHTYYGCVGWLWWGLMPRNDKKIMFSIGENISKINKYPLIPNFGSNSILPPLIGPSSTWMYGKHYIFSFVIELGYDELAPTDPEIVINMCKNHTGVNLYLCERALTLK